MIAADRPNRRSGKLLAIEANGAMRHLPRADLASLFRPGDVVIANDAATLPASLRGTHAQSDEPIEVRLAAWIADRDSNQFVAVAFGPGDYRTLTEERAPSPLLSPGDRLLLGPLIAVVERLLDHPRLLALRFLGDRKALLVGLAWHGRPIQYAHVPAPLALWDVWTSLAADPIAFEPPSAGFSLDWRMLTTFRRRGVKLATLTHAAGISSTGDPVLDLRLPFDEPYVIPEKTAVVINQAKADGSRIIAIGTTVVRALESAANVDGCMHAGNGIANGRIGRKTRLCIVDAILTGIHQPGESHFELLRAFADDSLLNQVNAAAVDYGYRTHEFGDSLLIERQSAIPDAVPQKRGEFKREFDQLITSMRSKLHRYSARMMGSIVDAEDVVQDALTKAYCLWPTTEVSNLEGWLLRIVHNQAIDYFRKAKRNPIDALDNEGYSPQVELAAPLEDAELARFALSIYLKLSPMQRGCVILKEVIGYSLEEISEMFDVSVGATKAALHRGRENLRMLANSVNCDVPLQLDEPAASLLSKYVERFSARDFDAVRAMLTDDVRLDLVERVKTSGHTRSRQVLS